MNLVRCLLVLLVASASAQFGFGKKKEKENAAGSLGDMGDMPNGKMASDIDRAMAGWQQLAQQPERMQDLMQAFKDPEVMAKAQEMLKDPQYMAAAQAKLAELQAKAQANGMLDANGNPVPGAHLPQGMGGLAQAMAAMQQGQQQAPQARDWEVEHAEQYKEGNLNTAEVGFKNLQHAMKNDPSMLGEVAAMMKDPENVRKVQEMMADPTFQRQAKAMAEQMKASGELPDFSKMGEAMRQMGMGGQRMGA